MVESKTKQKMQQEFGEKLLQHSPTEEFKLTAQDLS